jgi:hypothetical protein
MKAFIQMNTKIVIQRCEQIYAYIRDAENKIKERKIQYFMNRWWKKCTREQAEKIEKELSKKDFNYCRDKYRWSYHWDVCTLLINMCMDSSDEFINVGDEYFLLLSDWKNIL